MRVGGCRGRAALGYSRDGRARQCGRPRPGVVPCGALAWAGSPAAPCSAAVPDRCRRRPAPDAGPPPEPCVPLDSTPTVNRPTLFPGRALVSHCGLHVLGTHEDRTLPREHLRLASVAVLVALRREARHRRPQCSSWPPADVSAGGGMSAAAGALAIRTMSKPRNVAGDRTGGRVRKKAADADDKRREEPRRSCGRPC